MMPTEIKEEIILTLRKIDTIPLLERKELFLSLFQKSCDHAGFDVNQIANATRINPQFLEALHSGEFDKLPSEVFVRGFLKSIAKLFDLPTDILANSYSRTFRDELITPTPSRAAPPLGALPAPTQAYNELQIDKVRSSKVNQGSIQPKKGARIDWNFDANEAKLPTHNKTHLPLAKGGVSSNVGDKSHELPTEISKQPFLSVDGPLKAPEDLSQIAGYSSSDVALNQEDSQNVAGSERFSDSVGMSSKISESATSRKSRRPAKVKSNNPQNSELETLLSTPSTNPSTNPSINVADVRTSRPASQGHKAFIPSAGKETSGRVRRSISIKYWALLTGFAVILASIFWPRERAPNGTVIEESKVAMNENQKWQGGTGGLSGSESVSPDDSVNNSVSGQANESSGDLVGESAISAGLNGNRADLDPSEANSSANPRLSMGNLSESASGNNGPIFSPTAVQPVPLSALPRGLWSVPSSMILEINTKESVKLKAYFDGKVIVADELTPALHKFEFTNKAELFIYDAGAVEIAFNGKDLGRLGSKGQFKRLSFVKSVK